LKIRSEEKRVRERSRERRKRVGKEEKGREHCIQPLFAPT